MPEEKADSQLAKIVSHTKADILLYKEVKPLKWQI